MTKFKPKMGNLTVPTEPCNRTAYADNINYYKRIIQQATFKVNKITEQQAYQKLGYWEGRYDELTTGGGEV